MFLKCAPVLFLMTAVLSGCVSNGTPLQAPSVIGTADESHRTYSPQNIEFRSTRIFLWRDGTTAEETAHVIELSRRLAAIDSNVLFQGELGRRELSDREELLEEISRHVDLIDLHAEGIDELELTYDSSGTPAVRELPSGRMGDSASLESASGVVNFKIHAAEGDLSARIMRSNGWEQDVGSPVYFLGDVELRTPAGSVRKGFTQLQGAILPR